MASKERITSLDILKVWGMIIIVFFHATGRYGNVSDFAVSLFMGLTGFLLYYNYGDREIDYSFKGSCKFAVRKLSKLYWLHIVMMIIAISYFTRRELAGGFYPEIVKTELTKIITNVFLLQAWCPSFELNRSLNAPSWYLSSTAFFYLLFPFISKKINDKLEKTSSIILTGILVFVIQGLIAVLCHFLFKEADPNFRGYFANWFTYIFPVYRLGNFIIGSLLAKLFLQTKHKTNIVLGTLIEIITIVLYFETEKLSVSQNRIFDNIWIKNNLIFTPIVALFIYSFACKNGIVSKLLTNKVITYLANISGYVFLIHFMVIRYMMPVGIANQTVFVTVACVISIVLAIIWKNITKTLKR